MKRIVVVLIVTVALSAAVFARGIDEESNRTGNGRYQSVVGETAAVSGVLVETDDHVYLQAAGELYSVSAPGYRRLDLEIPFGEQIVLQGTMAEVQDDCSVDAAGHLFVESAVIDGEEYSIPAAGSREFGRGRELTSARPRSGSFGSERFGGPRSGMNAEANRASFGGRGPSQNHNRFSDDAQWEPGSQGMRSRQSAAGRGQMMGGWRYSDES